MFHDCFPVFPQAEVIIDLFTFDFIMWKKRIVFNIFTVKKIELLIFISFYHFSDYYKPQSLSGPLLYEIVW